MGYSNFRTLKKVSDTFGTDAVLDVLFDDIESVEPSLWLKQTLEIAITMPLSNEKTKSERLVSPILMEVVQSYRDSITLFSGEPLDVNPEQDLAGACDFLIVLAPKKPYIQAPIIALAEAKDEDMDHGIAQCAAQLFGAKLFNEKEGRSFPFLYGCATAGTDWQFLRFENNTFYVDSKIYTNISEILGVWHHILKLYL